VPVPTNTVSGGSRGIGYRKRIKGTQRERPPQKIFEFKKKMAHCGALLSIDFKVYRWRVSDHIIKTVTNRLCFLSFFRASEPRTRKYCDSGYKQPPVQGYAVANFAMMLATVCEHEHT